VCFFYIVCFSCALTPRLCQERCTVRGVGVHLHAGAEQSFVLLFLLMIVFVFGFVWCFFFLCCLFFCELFVFVCLNCFHVFACFLCVFCNFGMVFLCGFLVFVFVLLFLTLFVFLCVGRQALPGEVHSPGRGAVFEWGCVFCVILFCWVLCLFFVFVDVFVFFQCVSVFV